MEEEHETSSLNTRRKKPSMRIACCFKGHQRSSSLDVSSSSTLPSPIRSPSAWLKSKAADFPEIKGKYKSFMSRLGRHRRHSSADFSYDPLSYSLNFQDYDDHSDWEDPYRSFTSRLPVSPPKKPFTAPVSPSPSPAGIKPRKALSEIPSPRTSVDGADLSSPRRTSEVIEVAKSLEPERRSADRMTTPRAAAVAEVRRSLENVSLPAVVARTAYPS